MIYAILTEILQVMQYAPSTWLRTRTALIDLSALKILVLRPRPLWKFERGEKAAWIVLCRKCHTSKQMTKDFLWDVAYVTPSDSTKPHNSMCEISMRMYVSWYCLAQSNLWKEQCHRTASANRVLCALLPSSSFFWCLCSPTTPSTRHRQIVGLVRSQIRSLKSLTLTLAICGSTQ